MSKKFNYKSRDKSYIVLIVIAIIFGPFTQLRIGPIGVTELSMIFFIVKVFYSKRLKFNLNNRNTFIFTKFWLLFLLLSSFGLAYNFIFLGHVSGTIKDIIFDAMSYILVALVCFSIEVVICNYKNIDLWKVLNRIYIYSSSVILILFVISQFTTSLFGFSLVNQTLFRPLATNIHHVSMSISFLPFIGIKIFTLEKKMLNKAFILILIVSNFITAYSTGSLKVNLGFLAGAIVFIYFMINRKIRNNKIRILLLLSISSIFLTLFSVTSEQITNYTKQFFETEDAGDARENLYTSSVMKFLDSPIVGYGPGPHAELLPGVYFDAHQTLLTIVLQGGILALFAYVLMQWKIIKVCLRDPYIIGAYMGILLYALGGDIVRRLPMWIFLIIIYYYCQRRGTYSESVKE